MAQAAGHSSPSRGDEAVRFAERAGRDADGARAALEAPGGSLERLSGAVCSACGLPEGCIRLVGSRASRTALGSSDVDLVVETNWGDVGEDPGPLRRRIEGLIVEMGRLGMQTRFKPDRIGPGWRWVQSLRFSGELGVVDLRFNEPTAPSIGFSQLLGAEVAAHTAAERKTQLQVHFMHGDPAIRPLLLVLKACFEGGLGGQRRAKGRTGLSSYKLFCIVLFFRTQKGDGGGGGRDLSVLLVELLQLCASFDFSLCVVHAELGATEPRGRVAGEARAGAGDQLGMVEDQIREHCGGGPANHTPVRLRRQWEEATGREWAERPGAVLRDPEDCSNYLMISRGSADLLRERCSRLLELLPTSEPLDSILQRLGGGTDPDGPVGATDAADRNRFLRFLWPSCLVGRGSPSEGMNAG